MRITDQSGRPASPSITAPVSRTLTVTTLDRARAFYRDVLGFTQQTGDHDTLVLGAAQLRLIPAEGAPVPPPPAIVFFEVNDVALMQAAIRARGGHPSETARVNWMKVEFFSLQDPDGNVLWFGKTFHEFYLDMHTPPGTGQLRQIMPAFPVSDVPAAVAYYRTVLGFSVNYQQHNLGVMDRDSVRLLLVQRSGQQKEIGYCAVYIRDADALYAELIAKGANISAAPVSQPWGLREFQVTDPEGNVLTFAQTFE